MSAGPRSAIPFVKASASGNDFLIIDGMHSPANLGEFTRKICDRHRGVGADGVEWLFPDADGATVRARLFNADGSEAEISGNGTRCVAAHYSAEHGLEEIVIRTGAGVRLSRLIEQKANRFVFETEMGEPQVGEKFTVKLAFREVEGMPVSMGNPHYVVFVDEFQAGWQAEAAEIGRHHDFKYGINVELVRIRDKDHIEIRLFERGVGETLSSGTGSCAAAVAAIASGICKSPVTVTTAGGVQQIRWEGRVWLTGEAQLICRGEFFD
jgi:diaminopimelate epimerase